MKEFIQKLKAHLHDHKDVYYEENPWFGDTESGFHTETHLDIDKLMSEIDEFAKTFEPGGENDPGRFNA